MNYFWWQLLIIFDEEENLSGYFLNIYKNICFTTSDNIIIVNWHNNIQNIIYKELHN